MTVREISMSHPNGSKWVAVKKVINGAECYVLSNKNPLNHLDAKDGSKERGNEERFEIYVPDVRSVINGLQFGLSIRMVGTGNNGKTQKNLFVADGILIDGVPVGTSAP